MDDRVDDGFAVVVVSGLVSILEAFVEVADVVVIDLKVKSTERGAGRVSGKLRSSSPNDRSIP